MASFVAILAQFLVGYNTGVMNPVVDVVFPGHSTAQWSMAVAAFAVGGPGGAIYGGFLANRRVRYTIIIYRISYSTNATVRSEYKHTNILSTYWRAGSSNLLAVCRVVAGRCL
jgi:MFS family permease